MSFLWLGFWSFRWAADAFMVGQSTVRRGDALDSETVYVRRAAGCGDPCCSLGGERILIAARRDRRPDLSSFCSLPTAIGTDRTNNAGNSYQADEVCCLRRVGNGQVHAPIQLVPSQRGRRAALDFQSIFVLLARRPLAVWRADLAVHFFTGGPSVVLT